MHPHNGFHLSCLFLSLKAIKPLSLKNQKHVLIIFMTLSPFCDQDRHLVNHNSCCLEQLCSFSRCSHKILERIKQCKKIGTTNKWNTLFDHFFALCEHIKNDLISCLEGFFLSTNELSEKISFLQLHLVVFIFFHWL